jgi:surface antigen
MQTLGKLIAGGALVLTASLCSLAANAGGGYPHDNEPSCATGDCTPDPWGFFYRECTSFVAWKINDLDPNIGFSNYMNNGHWGNANHWDDNAKFLGYSVDSVPTVNSIAQWNGGLGHVAFVVAVHGSDIEIEEYNLHYDGKYSTRVISANSPDYYIHIIN